MKGKDGKKAPRKADPRLVTKLSPAVPPNRDKVLEDACEHAMRGAYHVLDDEAAASDLAQDYALEATEKHNADPSYLSDPVQRAKVSYAAGRNLAVDWLRRIRTREALAPEVVALYEACQRNARPDKTLEDRELRSAYEHELELLDPRKQSVWIGLHDNGLKPSEMDAKRARSISVEKVNIKKELKFILRRFHPGRET